MAITRDWQCGFETISGDEFTDGRFNSSQTAYTGARSNSINTAYPGLSYRSFYQDISASAQKRVGFHYRATQFGTSGVGVFSFRSGALRTVELKIYPSYDLELFVNDVSKGYTSNAPLVIDTWFHIGLDVKVDSSSGWANVYLNGMVTPILSFSGNTGSDNITRAVFGTDYELAAGGYNDWLYDDCYIDDTTGEAAPAPVPLKRFYWLAPNASGSFSQWNGSDGDSVNNYALVDERGPNDSDYVESDAADEYDSYGMNTQTIVSGETLKAVIPIVRAQKFGTGEQIKVGLRYSGVNDIGSARDVLYGGYEYLWERFTTKPGGGAWNQSAIDDFELLIQSSGSF
jgi:hypothetical protein